MHTEPYWQQGTSLPRFPKLDRDIDVDVVVIGGGVTGITTAHLIKESGARVALIERDLCCSNDTGHTTAHLTYVTDTRLNRIVKKFGKDCAQAYWDAGAVAIDEIERLVAKNGIDCELRRLPGYLHAPLFEELTKEELHSLQEDYEYARELGFSCEYLEKVPFTDRSGIRFYDQGALHPLKYLGGLLKTIPGRGSYVFEQSKVTEFTADPLRVTAGAYRIAADFLVIATHSPLIGNSSAIGATLFQTKLTLFTSYVSGARLPRGSLPGALWWDTSDPYYFLRVENLVDCDYAIFGGRDEKTGQEESAVKQLEKLEHDLQRLMPAAETGERWLGQVIETADGLPYIGETAERQFIGTGFGGNGFTLGTVSALMARDRFLQRANPWSELFDPGRKTISSGWRYISENVDYPYHLIRDRLKRAQLQTAERLAPGEGGIIEERGRKIAAFRDRSGHLHRLDPSCTHMRCQVRWNDADCSWDCPCHGSRFKATGEVMGGPAATALKRAD